MADSAEVIRDFADKLGLTGAQADDVARSLQHLSNSSRVLNNAQSIETQTVQQLEKSYRELKTATGQVGAGMSSLAQGMYATTSSVSGAGAAFTAIIPVMDLLQINLNRAIDSLGMGIQSFVAMIPGAGDGLQKFAELSKIVGKESLGFLFGLAKQQINAAQGLLQNFIQLSHTGMIFGGSMEEATKQANSAGLSLETFTAFATKNAEALAALEGNIQSSAGNIARLATSLTKSDKGLLELYGGYENLASALADYEVLQTRMGVNAVRSQDELSAGAKAYLLQQKELAMLTGKSAEMQKRDLEERMKTAAFARAMGKKTPEEQRNIMRAITDIQAKYGEDAAKQYAERVANEGEILSQAGFKFQAFEPAIDSVVQTLYENRNRSNKDYAEFQAQLIQSSAPAIKAQQDQNDQLLKLAGSGYLGEFGSLINRIGATVTATTSAQENAVEAQKKASLEIAAAAARTATSTGAIIDELEKFKSGMNDLTLSFLPQTKDMVAAMYDVAKEFQGQMKNVALLFQMQKGEISFDQFLELTGLKREAPKKSERTSTTEGVETEGGAVVMYPRTGVNIKATTVDLTGQNINVPAAQPSGPGTTNLEPQDNISLVDKILNKLSVQNPTQPKMADGGITQGQSTVGEAGPEAVIPLKGGKIPMQIDFDPVVKALQSNNDLMERLNRNMEDSKDIQQRILNASY